MNIITVPEPISIEKPSVFLAGGITNCPDWQAELIEMLSAENLDINVYNPRREDFDVTDPNASKIQIEWEFHALNFSTVISMWFTGGESLQPICLYELGRHLATRTSKDFVLGVDDNYKRKEDVYIQTKLVHPELEITNNLEDHKNNILNAIKRR